MKALMFAFAVGLILMTTVYSQSESAKPAIISTPTPITAGSGSPVTRRIVRLGAYGYVDLPDGFRIKDSGGSYDWWYCRIKSKDENFVINFSAGMVESVLAKHKKDIVWTREETSGELALKLALLSSNNEETMLAEAGRGQFSARVNNGDDKETFLTIIRSYRKSFTK